MVTESKNKKTISFSTRGFTLVELLVTIGIFVFMTALILSRYSSFNSGTLLNNVAYDTAITMRQAQSYGLSVKNLDLSTGNFSAGYGIHLSAVSPDDLKSFVLFADKFTSGMSSGDHMCAGDVHSISDCMSTSNGEGIQKYTLRDNMIISKFCGVLDGDQWPTSATDTRKENCNVPAYPWTFELKSLDIVFTRPNPDATFYGIPTNDIPITNYVAARIYIKATQGDEEEAVEISKNGQIAVRPKLPLNSATGAGAFAVTISASPSPVDYCGTPQITWGANYISTCTGGTLFDTQNKQSGNISANFAQCNSGESVQYEVQCTRFDGEFASNSVTVLTNPPGPLNVTIGVTTPNPADYGSTPKITWDSGVSASLSQYYSCNPESVSLFETGGLAKSISPVDSKVQIYNDPVTYKVTCTGPAGVVSMSDEVVVSPKPLLPSSSGGYSISIQNSPNGTSIPITTSYKGIFVSYVGIKSMAVQYYGPDGQLGYGGGANSLLYNPEQFGLDYLYVSGVKHVIYYGCKEDYNIVPGHCNADNAVVSDQFTYTGI